MNSLPLVRRWQVIAMLIALLSFLQASPLAQEVAKPSYQARHANDPGPRSRFAYVTVHYEGTSRDPEYVLGIQVLIQSLRLSGTPHDVVVLASDSVSAESKRRFRSMGCRVLDVSNIANPFVGNTLVNKNFIFTLNKLHVWNLLEYERVVYLDADNVVVRNADELFSCGRFCAVFMNPCHFHTGLLVVTPDANEYNRLLQSLNHSQSFDGADQGFLSHMYSQALRSAPLFNPNKMQIQSKDELPPGMRLPVGYNINHKYFYEQYHWKLFYLHHFASMTSPVSPVLVVVESARPIPALTIGFPMAPVLKPWYWWACYFMDLHTVWQDIRATLPLSQEKYAIQEAGRTLLRFSIALAVLTGVLYAFKLTLPMHRLREKCQNMAMRNNKRTRRYYMLFRVALVLITMRLAPVGVHPLAPISYGYALTIFMDVFLLIYVACVISNFWCPATHINMPPVLYVHKFWGYVGVSVLVDWFVVWVASWSIFPNIIIRFIFMILSLVLCGMWQVAFFRLSLDAEYGGKKERLRSL